MHFTVSCSFSPTYFTDPSEIYSGILSSGEFIVNQVIRRGEQEIEEETTLIRGKIQVWEDPKPTLSLKDEIDVVVQSLSTESLFIDGVRVQAISDVNLASNGTAKSCNYFYLRIPNLQKNSLFFFVVFDKIESVHLVNPLKLIFISYQFSTPLHNIEIPVNFFKSCWRSAPGSISLSYSESRYSVHSHLYFIVFLFSPRRNKKLKLFEGINALLKFKSNLVIPLVSNDKQRNKNIFLVSYSAALFSQST